MATRNARGNPHLGAIRKYADGGNVLPPPPPTSLRGMFNTAKSAFNSVGEQVDKFNARRAAAAEAKQKAQQEQQQQAPAPTPTGVSNGLDGAGGNSVDRRMKEAGAYAKGGRVVAQGAMRGAKIKGPGTATSDSIPGEVIETKEPIKVGNGERIVSQKQEVFLEKLAKDFGFSSVDEMLEAGTGQKVGPTVEYKDGDEALDGTEMKDGDGYARGGRMRPKTRPAMASQPKQSQPKQSQPGWQRGAPSAMEKKNSISDDSSLNAPVEQARTFDQYQIGFPDPMEGFASGGLIHEGGTLIAESGPEVPGEGFDKWSDGNRLRTSRSIDQQKSVDFEKNYLESHPGATKHEVHNAVVDDWLDRNSIGNERQTPMTTGSGAGGEMTAYRNGGALRKFAGGGMMTPGVQNDQDGRWGTSTVSGAGWKTTKGFADGGMPAGGVRGYEPQDGDSLEEQARKAYGRLGATATERAGYAAEARYRDSHPGASEAEVSNAVIDEYALKTPGVLDVGGAGPLTNFVWGQQMFKHGGAIRRFADGVGPDELATPTQQNKSTPSQQDQPKVGVLDRIFTPQEAWPYLAEKAAAAKTAETNRVAALGEKEKAAFQERNASQIARASGVPQSPPVSDVYPPEQSRAPAVNVQPEQAAQQTTQPAGALRKTTDLGNGITRIDEEGKSPLFTNLAGGADNPSNIALMNRKPITEQNQKALDGLQDRQDARDQWLRNQAQYDAEVAGARATNIGENRYHLMADEGGKAERAMQRKQAETTLASRYFSSPEQKQAALRQLDSLNRQDQDSANRSAALGRGFDAADRAQENSNRYFPLDVADRQARGALDRTRMGIDLAREGREAGTYAQQQAVRAKMEGLQSAYTKETDPDKRSQIENAIRVLGGKDIQPPYKTHIIPSVKNADGSTTEGGVYVENTRTGQGQFVHNTEAQPMPADPAQRKANVVYTLPNGGKARWDGKGAIPI